MSSLKSNLKIAGVSRSYTSQLLSTNGDGSGDTNAVGNYVSATEFYISPAVNKTLEIHRLLVHLTDTGSLDANTYGNGVVLTNGIQISLTNGTGTRFITTNPITNNGDWGSQCYDSQALVFGQGDESLNARWTFTRAGVPLTLTSPSHRLSVILNDDFTGLNEHVFTVQGNSYLNAF